MSNPNYYFGPLSNYLIRCVKKYPDLVTQIILDYESKNKEKRNSNVYGNFLLCAVDLPIDNAIKIAQKSLDEEWHGFVQNQFFLEKYLELLERLFSENELKLSTRIFKLIFTPQSKSRTCPKFLDEYPYYEDYEYLESEYPFSEDLYEEYLTNILTALTPKHPVLSSQLSLFLLEKALDMEHSQMNKLMPSTYWRSAIEEHEQNWDFDVKSLYVSKFKSSLLSLGKKDISELKDFMKVINDKKYLIFCRIELYIYTIFSDEFKPQIESSLLLYFDNINDVYHEYYNLIQKTFGTLSKSTQKQIIQKINQGFDDTEIQNRKIQYSEDEIMKQEKYWKLEGFGPIEKYLDEKQKRVFYELENEVGPIQTPGFLHYHSSVSVVEPPKPSEDFNDKSVDEVFQIVKTMELDWGIYARENQLAVNFGNFVKNNALECSKKAIELKDITPYLLYEFFSNIRDAIKDKHKIDWNGVLLLIEYLISNYNKELSSMSYDPIFELSKLLETALKEDLINFSYKDRLLPILKQIAEIGTINPHNDDKYLEENAMDALTTSINGIDGVSFHLLVNYLLWYKKHNNDKKFIEPKIKQILDDYLDKKLAKYPDKKQGNQTISRHTVFGLYLPNFYYLNKEWFNEISNKFGTGKKLKIAFWEGYVCHNRLFTDVFKEIHVLYAKMLSSNLLIDNKARKTYNSTLDHVILAYFYDFDKVDGYFMRFLKDNGKITRDENNHDRPIDHCIFQISNVIKDKKKDQKFNKEKLIELWQHELLVKHGNLEDWFRNSPLDKEKTIKLHHDYLEKHPGKFNLVHSEISELEKYVESYPIPVADCIKLLIENKSNNYIPRDKIRKLLTLLLENDDENVQHICKNIIDRLARLNYDFRDLLV